MKKIVYILAIIVSQFSIAQEKGTIKGLLLDKEMDNEPLPFANVIIKGTTIGLTTEINGTYTIKVDAGSYIVQFSFLGYETIEVPVTVISGETVTVNRTLGASEGVTLEEVKIKATVSREKESALLVEQKKAILIKESIGAQRLAQIGVSNAATATSKISGVTKSEGTGYIYIRGLGDRYLSTSMNGLPIPSNNVNNKNIDLSLFSTNVINNIGISKTYNTASYADQASGNVDVTSKRFSRKGFSVGLSGAINTAALGVHQFKQSIVMNDVNFFGYHTSQYTTTDAILYQGWDPINAQNVTNYSFSLSGAYKFDIFDKELSVIATASQSR